MGRMWMDGWIDRNLVGSRGEANGKVVSCEVSGAEEG